MPCREYVTCWLSGFHALLARQLCYLLLTTHHLLLTTYYLLLTTYYLLLTTYYLLLTTYYLLRATYYLLLTTYYLLLTTYYCLPGSFADAVGSAECTPCEVGSFQSAPGAIECNKCPNRTFSSTRGAAECNNCLSRLSSYIGSARCDICDAGFFRFDEMTRAEPETCWYCPGNGAECPTDTTSETMVVLPGHWRLSGRSRMITRCTGINAVERCRGGRRARKTNTSAEGEGYCGDPFSGPECLLCRAGKAVYHDKVTGECRDCPSIAGRLALLAGVLLSAAAVVAACHRVLFHREALQSSFIVRWIQRPIHWLVASGASIGFRAKFKIIFSFYGVITSLDSTYDAKLPESYTGWVSDAFGWAQLDLSSILIPSEVLTTYYLLLTSYCLRLTTDY